MSCVVGMQKPDGGLIFGGDGRISDADSHGSMSDPKVFAVGEFLYGATGSLRNSQILKYKFTAPPVARTWAPMRYVCEVWVDAFREAVTSARNLRVKEDVVGTDDSDVLIGLRGKLFTVQADFSVFASELPYQAIGSGEPFVLGALDAFTRHTRLSVRRQVLVALEICASHNPSVGAPYTLIESSP